MKKEEHLLDNENYSSKSNTTPKSSGEVNKSIYPEQNIPFSKKLELEYGLGIAKFIAGDWFSPGGRISGGCSYLQRKEWIRQKRLFVRGEQDSSYYKDNFRKGDKDLDFINIDWSNVNFPQKFCRIVSNGISD